MFVFTLDIQYYIKSKIASVSPIYICGKDWSNSNYSFSSRT